MSKADALYGKRIAVSNRSHVGTSIRSTDAPSNRMSFGVQDCAIEIERLRWREQQIEIFEGFCEQKALHRIGLLFCNDAFQRSISIFCATVLNEVAPHRLAHSQVVRIIREVIKIISRLNYLGTKRIAGGSHLHTIKVQLFWLNSIERPHLERRQLKPPGAIQIA